MKAIETKKTEQRLTTSNPDEMLDKYTTRALIRTQEDTFTDEETGEEVSVTRQTILLDKGILINEYVRDSIKSWLNEGYITEVEVSSQQRLGNHCRYNRLMPYKASVKINDRKKESILLYADSAAGAIETLTDYVELNFNGNFAITDLRQLDFCVVLVDKFKYLTGNEDGLEVDYLQEKDILEKDDDTEVNEEGEETDNDTQKLKFYQILANIKTITDGDEENESEESFIVQTFSAVRANDIIELYLRRRHEQFKLDLLKQNPSAKVVNLEIFSSIEESKILHIGHFIPRYFSEAYAQ